jgi:predicted transcriptional regulator
VWRTLDSLMSGETPAINRLTPAPAVKLTASVFEDHVVCLGCGKHVQMLRRHIRIAHRMSPVEYRRHWGLPAAYPMVAPNYAKVRAEVALKSGLGHRRIRWKRRGDESPWSDSIQPGMSPTG